MKQLPYELQRYILEFIPPTYCKFCNKRLFKINNNFCNNICVLRYNNILWGDLVYIRNSVLIITISWSPMLLYPSINDNDNIFQAKYKWYCGILSFIILTIYTEQYFFYKIIFKKY